MIDFFRGAAKVFFIISFIGLSIALFIGSIYLSLAISLFFFFGFPVAEIALIAIYSVFGTFLGIAEDTEDMREQLNKIKSELVTIKKEIGNSAQPSEDAPIRRPAPTAAVNNGSFWYCKNCGTTNKSTDSFCKDCGEYK